ncbi:MAG: hypothetical protein H0T42_15835 [Deltaproteobacteria bacterium]|nr:hypothetical protein [Deltaproteobacteria bacterium]
MRLALILSLSTILAADAFAQAPGETAIVEPAPAPEVRSSYRRQLIIADTLAVATVGAGVAAGVWIYDPEDFHLPMMVGALGFTSFVTTAPVIHFAHGNVGRGFLSLGARILLPAVVGSTLAVGLNLEEHDDAYGTAMGTGFAVGAVAAIVLDWFVLTPSTVRRAAEHPVPHVAPTFSASTEHVFLGLGGSL